MTNSNIYSFKPRGLFLNTAAAQCSIYESGRMAYDCLRFSDLYQLDYIEIDRCCTQIGVYDFYLFNYHHETMAWLNIDSIRQLPGRKFTLVLETLPGNPFVLCPSDVFDAYLTLDPTMDRPDDHRVYAFPRPLESPSFLPPFQEPTIPIIGTFGFATPGKGFERVVDAVNREFHQAIVRINIPSSTYADDATCGLHRTNYAAYLADLCRCVANPGIHIQFTSDFLSKEQLIRWCARNSLNCFLYHRDQPGLAATTDQAIASGRPLAISANETFRHIHAYVKPYPFQTLRQSLENSTPSVLQMQHDWAPQAFARKFEGVLADFSLLPSSGISIQGLLKVDDRLPLKRKVLVVSHKEIQCGIHQYGLNIVSALNKSSCYTFEHALCASPEELHHAILKAAPAVVIYNYYPATMPWLTPMITKRYTMPCLGVMHEVTQEEADKATTEMFDFHLCPDPTLVQNNPYIIPTKRLIPHFLNMQPEPPIPVFGSFGFGFGNKGFHSLVVRIQEEYDQAIIKLHMPFNDIVDTQGKDHALATARHCQLAIRKSGIRLEINHTFLKKKQLLEFLARNTLNCFFYDRDRTRGISSVIEHALAVERPIAITRCGMFRHVLNASPSICIEDNSLHQIIDNGIAPLVPFYNEWSEANFIKDYERILANVLRRGLPAADKTVRHLCEQNDSLDRILREKMNVGGAGESSLSNRVTCQDSSMKTSVGVFNRILDDDARRIYANQIQILFNLVPEMMGRKIPQANVQQAFVLDTVQKIVSHHIKPKILCVGSYEDTAAAALKKLGYQIDEIDPVINYDLNTFSHLPTTQKGSYDIIFSTSVIEHVEDDERFISQVSDLLAPKGVAILTVDYNNSYRAGDRIPEEDFRFYTREDLEKRLLSRAAGCSLVDTPKWDCPRPDFCYSGCLYAFASFVFQKQAEIVKPDALGAVMNHTFEESEAYLTADAPFTSEKEVLARSLTLVNVSRGFETGIIPLGLTSISAYLKKHGGFRNIQLIDSHCQDIFESFRPADIVGISAVTQTINQASRYASFVRARSPKSIIILGGVHISTIRDLPESFDIGVVGEGEQTMLELMQLTCFKVDSLKNVKGICYRLNGNLVFTEERGLIAPLDRVPMPDRELVDLKHYLKPRQIIPYHFGRSMTLITSRGCPFNCVFCSTRVHGKKFRAFSAERVVSEMELLINTYQTKIIHIFDDLFIADRTRLRNIHRLVLAKEINRKVKFMCLVRADMLDDETMKLLKEMNVVVTGIGMESGCEATLRYLKRNTTRVADNRRAIELSIKYKIPSMGTFMVGNPGETEPDLLETLDFIQSYRYTPFFTPLTYITTAFPGTELWEYAKKKGIRVEDYDHILMDIPDTIEALKQAPLITDLPLEKFFPILQLFALETRYGATKKELLEKQLAISQKEKEITESYQKVLGRTPLSDELNGWRTLIQDGVFRTEELDNWLEMTAEFSERTTARGGIDTRH